MRGRGRGGLGRGNSLGTYSPAWVLPSSAQTRLRGRRAAEVRTEARVRARVGERVKSRIFRRGRGDVMEVQKMMD